VAVGRASGRDRGQALADQMVALVDQVAVPRAADLLVQGDELPRRRDARRPPGLGEQHEGQQPGHLAASGRFRAVVVDQLAHQAGQPDRLAGEVRTDRVRPGPGDQVALVEHQEQHREHTVEACREVVSGGDPVRDVRGLDLGLGAGDASSHGRLLHQEGAGDLGHRQPGDHP
jgi:hypothetical protein